MSSNRHITGLEPVATRTDHSRIRSHLRAALLDARNGDGGWGYSPRRRSRIEPTSWAALALGHSEGHTPDVASLRAWKRQNGWLMDVPGAPPNTAFNALAALTFLQEPSAASLAKPIVDRLVATKGLRSAQHKALRQDNSLQAWPWVDGTASWVEPTAWCLLLLKKVRAQSLSQEGHERIRIGEQLLFDRVCHDGGWNYGNSEVYGQKLWPYVPTTALALLAMRDHPNHPVVTQSLEQLKKDVASERSVVALSLTIICLREYGMATSALERALTALTVQADPANLLGSAMMLYALTDGSRRVAFTV